MDDENATCGLCGSTLQLVRPGKHQCDWCERVDGIVALCRKRKIPRVYASTQYGLGFILAGEGPHLNGILFREDTMDHSGRERLAADVNERIRPDQFRDATKMISPTNAGAVARQPGENVETP